MTDNVRLCIVASGWISFAIGAWGLLREYKSRRDSLVGAGFFCLLVVGAAAPIIAIFE